MSNYLRPVVITAIGWTSIALGVLQLSSPIYFALRPNPPFESITSANKFLISIGALFLIIAGAGLLKGKNWARIAFLFFIPLSILLPYLFNGRLQLSELLTGIISWLVLFYYLSRPYATQFFGPHTTEDNEDEFQTEKPNKLFHYTKRAVSIVCLIASGLTILTFAVMLYIDPLTVNEMILKGLMFGISAILLSVIAIYLWGWDKWAILLGYFFVYTGLLMTLIAWKWKEVALSPAMIDHTPTIDKIQLGSRFTELSIIFFGIGLLLVYVQRLTDQKKLSQLMTDISDGDDHSQ